MAVGRTQIRLGALTGSLDDSGAPIVAGALNVDSLQGSLDALAAAQQRQIGAVPAGSWYSLDRDVLSIAAEAAVSGSLVLKSGAGALKARINNNGEISGSVLHIGSLGAGRQAVLADKDADVVFGFGGSVTNRFIELDAGDAGASGGIKAILGADADTSVFAVKNQSLADKFTVDGAGDALIAGNLEVAGGNIKDDDAQVRVSFPSAGALVIKSADGASDVLTVADALITSAQAIDSAGKIEILDATDASSAADAAASFHTDGGASITKKLWVGTDLDVTGTSTLDGDVTIGASAIINGDLTVNGTTTTIDTTNLDVEDALIGLNYTSGSISGGARDAGLILGQTGGNSPVAKAFYYDSATSKFKIVETATAASGTNIVDGTYQRLAMGDAEIRGGNIDVSAAATTFDLSAGASALQYDVGGNLLAEWDGSSAAAYGLGFQDNISVYFGADNDGRLAFSSAADQLILSSSGTTDLRLGVDAGDDIRLQVESSDVLILDGGKVQSTKKIVGPSGNSLLLSSSAGRNAQLSATGGEVRFHDGNILGSSWSVDRIKLSAATSEWDDFETNFGEVSLLNAIVQAKGSALGASKNQFPLTSDVDAGTVLSSGTGATTINMTGTTPAGRQKGVDVFVNGQLMHSGTEAQRAAGTADYNLVDGTVTAVDVKFAFLIQADDVVSVVVR